MNTRRLLMLATLMDKVSAGEETLMNVNGVQKPERFDMGSWYCNSSACAWGYAMFYPPFIAEGLQLKRYHTKEWVACEPKFGQASEGFGAAMEFFDLTEQQTAHLFFPERYGQHEDTITPEVVAKRIRSVVRQAAQSDVFLQQ